MSSSQKPSFVQVCKSVFAAAVGVQSEKNRQQDFQSSTIWPFIVGGILFTALFVGGLIILVSLVSS